MKSPPPRHDSDLSKAHAPLAPASHLPLPACRWPQTKSAGAWRCARPSPAQITATVLQLLTETNACRLLSQLAQEILLSTLASQRANAVFQPIRLSQRNRHANPVLGNWSKPQRVQHLGSVLPVSWKTSLLASLQINPAQCAARRYEQVRCSQQ